MTEQRVSHFVVEDAGTTVLHPIGLLLLIAAGTLLVALPRKYALWPFIALTCFVSSRQCIAIGGLNLYFARVMVLVFGLARLLIKGEFKGLQFNALDWTIMAYGITYLLAGGLNWGLDSPELKTRSGYLVEVVGIYFLMRLLIRNSADVEGIITCLAIVALPVAGFFLLEFATGRDLFAAFGGVPEVTAVRDGRLRCQGPFGHPILAGTIWASFVPVLIYGMLSIRRRRLLMIAAAFAAIAIVIMSGSSTPVLGLTAVFAGVVLYPFRRYTRHTFAATGVILVALHLVMKAPVWSLIQRVKLTPGDSGYHRFILVDGFIQHWHEWWLLGTTLGTAHWGHFTFDTANQYVAVGTAAGLSALVFFMASIVIALLGAGRISQHSPLLGWALGVTIMVHCVCFFGISIWDQLHFAWNLPLAMIGSLAFPAVSTGGVPASGLCAPVGLARLE